MEGADGWLIVRFAPNRWDDGSERVRVSASANGFSGRGYFWSYRDSLFAFAKALRTYPLDANDPPRLGDHWTDPRTGSAAPLDVRIEALPIGPFGQVGLVVSLREADQEHPRGSRHLVKLELLTTYERLGRFADDLTSVAKGESVEARIDQELLA